MAQPLPPSASAPNREPSPEAHAEQPQIEHSADSTPPQKTRTSVRFSTYSMAPSFAPTVQTTDSAHAEIRDIATGLDRMENKALSSQRVILTEEKTDNMSKLALGAKLERALDRRMSGQDAVMRPRGKSLFDEKHNEKSGTSMPSFKSLANHKVASAHTCQPFISVAYLLCPVVRGGAQPLRHALLDLALNLFQQRKQLGLVPFHLQPPLDNLPRLRHAAHLQQADASRPGSTVRDSFTSLRRTSVATFFTSTSEQTSHRSSMLSTSTTTNDTEMGAAPGLDSMVESVDFSKWA
ncbi:hypothetical protein G7046_g1334 [Stylonectria norvegica]|nr:hypothetical protein G7046_g1334 [Stylonectria norvegica]